MWESIFTCTPFCRTGLVECREVVLVEVAQRRAATKSCGDTTSASLSCVARQGLIETTETGSAALLTLSSSQCRKIAEIELSSLALPLRLPSRLP